MIRNAITCLWLFLCVLECTSATYYIDWDGGSDANAGTSTGAAWKRHPYMRDWAGSYTHVVGDIFIFKGGVTWPSNAFQMNIIRGGNSTAPDVYTISNGWFTGASWSRPVFDFEATAIGSFSAGAGVLMANVGYIVLDNIQLKRHRSVLAPNNQQSATIQTLNTTTNIFVLNCYIHDWDLVSTPGPNECQGNAGGVAYVGVGAQGFLVVSNCHFNQSGVSMRTGTPISAFSGVYYCVVSNTATCYVGGGFIANNYFHHTQSPSDNQLHSNGILTQGSAAFISNNILHDLCPESTGIYMDTPSASLLGTGTNLVVNNVLYNTVQVPVQCNGGTNVGLRCFNNTLVGVGNVGPVIRVTDSGGTDWWLGLLSVTNNHFIINSGDAILIDDGVITAAHGNNSTQTVATANSFGAVVGNHYRPTLAAAPTVNAGVSLSWLFGHDVLNITRPQGIAWDIGAFELILDSLPTRLRIIGPVSISGPSVLR